MFTDYYFYLIAFRTDEETNKPYYFRIDRITRITTHRKKFDTFDTPEFDEGLLRRRSLFMWPGKLRTIRFEFSGPSVQAALDKLPTAKIIERLGGNKYLSVSEWCRQRGVTTATYYRWERELLTAADQAPCSAVPAVTFAELPEPKKMSRNVSERCATLRIGSACLDIYPGCDAEQLRLMVELLRLC